MLHVTRCMAASRLGLFIALLALSGCDSATSSATPPATPPPTVVPLVGAGLVTFDTVDRAGDAPPKFIAWQDGDGPWQNLPSTLNQTLNVTDPAGRYSIAVGDATTPPRNSNVDSSSGITTSSSGYIVHMTRAEATDLSLPLGIPPTQLYDISTRVTTVANFAQIESVNAFKDDVGPNTINQAFPHFGLNLIPGASYATFVVQGTTVNQTPLVQTPYFHDKQTVPALPGLIDFAPVDFNIAPIPGPDVSCFGLFGLNPRVNVTGVPAGKHVGFTFGLMTMQGVTPLVSAVNGHSSDVISTGATISIARTPVSVFSNSAPSVFQHLSVSTTDASSRPIAFQTTYTGCADINLAFPPTSLVVTTPTAAPSSLPAYPRIRVPFTTLPAGTVHVISVGKTLPVFSPTTGFGWTVLASTGWFGGEGKAVTWDFPDFSALAISASSGWINELWKTWTLTAPAGVSVRMQALACDTASNGVSVVIGRAMPAGCKIGFSPINTNVTLP